MPQRMSFLPAGLSLRNAGPAPSPIDVPVLMREEAPLGGLAMILTALAGVIFFAMEPAASVFLLFSTFAIAVHTTALPETKAWAIYHEALRSPIPERMDLLKAAENMAPSNMQVRFVLGLSYLEAGRPADAVNQLRPLHATLPASIEVEGALLEASRAVLSDVRRRLSPSA